VDDRVTGLRAGGDDYLTKPFSFSELLARVEVLGRRRGAKVESGIAIGGTVGHVAGLPQSLDQIGRRFIVVFDKQYSHGGRCSADRRL